MKRFFKRIMGLDLKGQQTRCNCTKVAWRGCSWTLTFDIAETGPGHPFTEVDERPLRLTSRQDVVVVSHSDDPMGSHGRYLKKKVGSSAAFQLKGKQT